MRYLLIRYINRALYRDYIDCLLIAMDCCLLLFAYSLLLDCLWIASADDMGQAHAMGDPWVPKGNSQ